MNRTEGVLTGRDIAVVVLLVLLFLFLSIYCAWSYIDGAAGAS